MRQSYTPDWERGIAAWDCAPQFHANEISQRENLSVV